MEKEQLYDNLNKGILEERYHAFRSNIRKNLNTVRISGGLENIVSRLSGKHIIIAGAGPSLEDAYEGLKKYQARRDLVIIAADIALRPLLRNRISPHFVISCETTPVEFFNALETKDLHLLAFSCMSAVNLRIWRGNTSFFNWMLHNELYDKLWETAGMELGFVATGGIVTTQAVSLALGCGIASLMLTGNDLAFSSSFYARETIRHKQLIDQNQRFASPETIEQETILRNKYYEIKRGANTYYTNHQFLSAKLWIEELFEKQKIPIYDCSIPGCADKYVKKLTVKQYFRTLDTRTSRR